MKSLLLAVALAVGFSQFVHAAKDKKCVGPLVQPAESSPPATFSEERAVTRSMRREVRFTETGSGTWYGNDSYGSYLDEERNDRGDVP